MVMTLEARQIRAYQLHQVTRKITIYVDQEEMKKDLNKEQGLFH